MAIGTGIDSPKQHPAPGPAPARPAAPAPAPPNPLAPFLGGATGSILTQQQQADLLAGLQQNLTLSGSSAQADLTRKTYAQQLANALSQYGLQGQQIEQTLRGIQLGNQQAWRQSQDALRNLYGQRAAAGAIATSGTGYQRGLISQQLKDALARANIAWQQAILSKQGLGLNATQAQQQYANNLAQLGLSQGQSASQAQLAYMQAIAQNAAGASTAEQNLIMPFLQTLLSGTTNA